MGYDNLEIVTPISILFNEKGEKVQARHGGQPGDFADKKIELWGQCYDLRVVLLEYAEQEKSYYQKNVSGGSYHVK